MIQATSFIPQQNELKLELWPWIFFGVPSKVFLGLFSEKMVEWGVCQKKKKLGSKWKKTNVLGSEDIMAHISCLMAP